MRYALIGFMVLLALAVGLLYSACVVGSEADDREERWFRKKG